MSEQIVIAALVRELGRTADQRAVDSTSLVSINIDMIAEGDLQEVRTELTRQTRTLLFVRAEALSDNGTLLATASSVHKITPR